MGLRARVFMSGRSQALRLPARLRLSCPEVEIESMGQALWVQPCQAEPDNLAAWLEGFYRDHPPLPETFLDNRADPLPQERDWA